MTDQTRPATAEEIEMFKAGAAARYAEKGVAPDKAKALFESHMSKAAEALGLTAPTPSATAVKIAAAIKAGITSK